MNLAHLNTQAKLFEVELIGRMLQGTNDAVAASQLVSAEDFNFYPAAFTTAIDVALNGKNLAAEFSANKLSLSSFLDSPSLRPIEAIAFDLKEVANARRVNDALF